MPPVLYHKFTGFDESFDAIVIGSGIGGLSVASILSKAGKKVLLLEQHTKIGGYTHTFKRKGYEWDVGLHYVGQVHFKGTTLHKTFRYITNGQLQWAPMDDAYDKAVFGTTVFDFVCGKENQRAQLKKYFPAEKDARSIDTYFELLEKVGKIGPGFYVEKVIPPFFAKLFGPWLRRKVLQYSDQTTLSVLRSITDNEKLIGVLTAQYGDYGLTPARSSFYMHALLANHYMDGGAYPVGGAGRIAETVLPVIEASGGAALFLAEVKNIIVEKNKAIGVVMADGKKIYAPIIISDAGVMSTFSNLLPEEVIHAHNLREKLKNLEPSAAHMGLYISFKESAKALKLPRCNYWIFPDEYDHERNWKRYGNINDPVPVSYISFPAAKNPEWEKTHPGTATVEVIIIVPYQWFAQWGHTVSKQRGTEYDELKKRVADQLFEELYRVEPQLRGKVDYFEISSPLSTRKYTNHEHGEIYGVAHTPRRFRQVFLKPHTPVKNLYLTGQDVMIASIAGGLMGGVLCASAILKKNVLSQINRSIP